MLELRALNDTRLWRGKTDNSQNEALARRASLLTGTIPLIFVFSLRFCVSEKLLSTRGPGPQGLLTVNRTLQRTDEH
jgi:hypothetical protein